MAERRYCQFCAEDVDPREERTEHAVALYCPQCDRRMATLYGEISIQ